MSATNPSATVILPSQSGDRSAAALASLAAQRMPHETIVVDNGSPGGEVTEAARGYDFARVLQSEENLGFSRAVNMAAREASADSLVLVLVNDDARYDPDFVGRVTAALDPKTGVAMVAGVLRAQRDERTIDTAGIEIDRTLLGFDYLHGAPVGSLSPATPDPFGPSGAAAAYARSAFDRLGGLDERLFAYFEDLDLAIRMRLAGLSCRLVPDARGTHWHSATLGPGSRRKDYLMGFARGYLLRKWGVVSASRVPGVALREAVICAGQAVVDRNAEGIRGRRAGWRSAPTGDYPASITREYATLSLAQSLRRRARRRGKLRVRR